MSVPARFVHVGFNFGVNIPPVAEIAKIFESATDWVRYDPHCWILYTTTELETWRDRIRNSPAIKSGDSFFLCEFAKAKSDGYQTQLVWDWFKKHQK
jgi:hypothetical protein